MLLKKPLLALFALSLFSGVTAHAESLSDWDVIVVGESNTGEYYDAVYTIKKLNTVTGSTEILSTKTFSGVPGISGNPLYSVDANRVHFGTNEGNYYYDLDSGEWGLSLLTIFDGFVSGNIDKYATRHMASGGSGGACTEVGNDNGAIEICPPDSDEIQAIHTNGSPLIGMNESDEIYIGENSLITIEQNGRQNLHAKDANCIAIPIDITEVSYLLINGVSVNKSIATNTSDIDTNKANIATNASNIQANKTNIATNASDIDTNKTNIAINASDIDTNKNNISKNASNIHTNSRKIKRNSSNIKSNKDNINDLGYGVAGATALTAALSSLPVASYDAPISCGIGTGGYSSRFAMGLGCAARLNERLSLNLGGSHVFGGSSNYGGGSLGTIAARGGFVFKLGTIHKNSSLDGEELQSQLDEVKRVNASIRQENKELLA